jgi:hypothetical protein
MPLPTSYIYILKFVKTHEQSISDVRQCPIPSVLEQQILMKVRVKKRQFLGVKVTVKVR